MLDQLRQVLLADSVLRLDVQQDDPNTNLDLKNNFEIISIGLRVGIMIANSVRGLDVQQNDPE